MSKLTSLQKDQLERYTLDTITARLTTSEAQQYIKDMLGIKISIDYINHLKLKLKKDSKKQLEHLQKDRWSFVNSAFFDRLKELESMQRMLHHIIEHNKHKPSVQILAIAQLHQLTHSLYELYRLLPSIISSVNLGAADTSYRAAVDEDDDGESYNFDIRKLENNLTVAGHLWESLHK